MTEPEQPKTFEQAQAELEEIVEQPKTFEQAQAELEQIVERLERGQAPLDEALKLWERGEELYAFCKAKLDAAEGRVEELARRAEQSRLASEG